MTDAALRVAAANAFLFRCSGISDLALGYLRDSFKLAAQAAGKPALAAPPRGLADRFTDWLDAARDAGLETAVHRQLREACARVPADPPPLSGAADFTPAMAEDSMARAAFTAAFHANQAHHRRELAAAKAGYWFALLLAENERNAHFNLGVLCVDDQAWDQAIRHFEEVLAQEPTAQDALTGMHNVALKGNRMAALAPHLETLLKSREKVAVQASSVENGPATAAPIMTLTERGGLDVAGLILRRGAAHIRGATRPDACAELLARANAWFAANPDRLSWPVLEFEPLYRDPHVLLNPEMAVVLEEIFGRTPALSPLDTYLRCVTPQEEATYIPFHQDVTALATTGVNVWVPLIPCGEDAPGLEIMARRTVRIFPTVTSRGDYNQTEIEAATVYEEFPPETRFYPKPVVGDAVAFLGSTVHRSHIAPGMTRPRLSLEMRFY